MIIGLLEKEEVVILMERLGKWVRMAMMKCVDFNLHSTLAMTCQSTDEVSNCFLSLAEAWVEIQQLADKTSPGLICLPDILDNQWQWCNQALFLRCRPRHDFFFAFGCESSGRLSC
ncbi:hypothetical protein Dimus_037543 [Dionaea muscipula]